MRKTGIAGHVFPRVRDAALIAAAATLAATLGSALVGGLSWNIPPPALEAPLAPPREAPAQERAPVQPVVPDAPTQAPMLTAAPSAPAAETLPAAPARRPFESLPVEQPIPSFRPGGLPPPYASIPPQN